MSRQLLLSVAQDRLRLALLADGVLTDLATESAHAPVRVGQIYKGIVKNVVPALDAAFVDIGTGVNAYLPLLGGRTTDMHERKISVGASVMVQVSKTARGTKGPMVTPKVSLAGRYAVLLTEAAHVGVSKKVTSDDERARLRRIGLQRLAAGDNHFGLVFRTAAQGVPTAAIEADIDYLLRTYTVLHKRALRTRGAVCLYREADLVVRTVRDGLDGIDEIKTDDAEVYERLCELIGEARPALAVTYERDADLFGRYGVDSVADELLARRVDLPGGGYLVIDPTEALTAIDVNSGTARTGRDREEAALRVNLEAADAIARQLRLRNIGGMIIVDFISMRRPAYQQQLLTRLRTAVRTDRVRTTVLDMTALGLVEMTRQKTGETWAESWYEHCPSCNGNGYVRTAASIAAAAVREVCALPQAGGTPLVIEVHADVCREAQVLYPPAILRRLAGRTVRWEPRVGGERDVVSILADRE